MNRPSWYIPTARDHHAGKVGSGLTRADIAQARELHRPLVAVRDFAHDDRDLGLTLIRAGVTRVHPSHRLAYEHPECFELGPARGKSGEEPTERRNGGVASLADHRHERAATDAPGTMFGHFAVFDRWAEINSVREGQFLERIAPGAFARTLREDNPKVIFSHCQDAELGSRPIGSIRSVGEDTHGVAYSVDLFRLPPIVLDGLRANEYGASFRFRTMREDFIQDAEVSAHNPLGLPERTLLEVLVHEFGPTTWGAYPDATSNLGAQA